MQRFIDYAGAHAFAVKQVKAHPETTVMLIKRSPEFGRDGFNVSRTMVDPAKRFGRDADGEIVDKGNAF